MGFREREGGGEIEVEECEDINLYPPLGNLFFDNVMKSYVR